MMYRKTVWYLTSHYLTRGNRTKPQHSMRSSKPVPQCQAATDVLQTLFQLS